MLDDLRFNAQGDRVRLLVMDMQCTMVWAGLPIKRNHSGLKCSVGLVDGSARAIGNDGERFTLNGSTSSTFERLDAIPETADAQFR
jgi:hypothetical protein